jgi:hypothetical protein
MSNISFAWKCDVSNASSQQGQRIRVLLSLLVCATLFVQGCSFGQWSAIDGHAAADVRTWHDADGDGEWDESESPLAWVTIAMSYELSITDSSGQGTIEVFKPACVRKCWEGELVSVRVPPGYQATTPVGIELTGRSRTYDFGLRVKENVRLLSFPNEPGWFRAFLNRGLDVVAFHYDVAGERVSLSLNPAGFPNRDALYREIFDVVFGLQEVEGILVQWLEITLVPAGEVTVCEVTRVREWTGKMTPTEIVSGYCRDSG